MVTAQDVAKYFLILFNQDDDPITHLKLQKLLYYSQGIHLAVFDEPLFFEPIEAWPHGPVVSDVYHQYKVHDSSPIPCTMKIRDLDLSEGTEELLEEVYEMFGQFSAFKLRNMTHNEPPWKETPEGQEISREKIQNYFRHQRNFNFHTYSEDSAEQEELVLRRMMKNQTVTEFILTRKEQTSSDAEENRLLIESGVLPKLIEQARQQKPSLDWEKELDEL